MLLRRLRAVQLLRAELLVAAVVHTRLHVRALQERHVWTLPRCARQATLCTLLPRGAAVERVGARRAERRRRMHRHAADATPRHAALPQVRHVPSELTADIVLRLAWQPAVAGRVLS